MLSMLTNPHCLHTGFTAHTCITCTLYARACRDFAPVQPDIWLLRLLSLDISNDNCAQIFMLSLLPTRRDDLRS
jgi:hypothetical protein